MIIRGAPRPSLPPRGSANVMAMLHDSRVLFLHSSGTTFGPVMRQKKPRQVPLTVVIPVHDILFLDEALRSLILQQYDSWRILLVCSNPANRDIVYSTAVAYRQDLPPIDLFVTSAECWLSDALNAALPLLRTSYWCRLDPDDLLHPMALHVVSDAIQREPADCYYSARFFVDRALRAHPVVLGHTINAPHLVWSGKHFPYSHLITYNVESVVAMGGFKSYDKYPNDAEWIMAYEMLAAGKKFHYINGAIYYKRHWEQSATAQEKTTPADYRRGLILSHWPQLYQEDYSSQ